MTRIGIRMLSGSASLARVKLLDLMKKKLIEYEMAINDERQQIGQFQAHWELGHDEGLQEGLQEGVAKGRDEERISIARNCKAMGMDAASIARVTGLSETEIAEL